MHGRWPTSPASCPPDVAPSRTPPPRSRATGASGRAPGWDRGRQRGPACRRRRSGGRARDRRPGALPGHGGRGLVPALRGAPAEPWPARAHAQDGPGADGPTARELELLGLMVEGLSNRAIAERLVISEDTAGRHVSNIRQPRRTFAPGGRPHCGRARPCSGAPTGRRRGPDTAVRARRYRKRGAGRALDPKVEGSIRSRSVPAPRTPLRQDAAPRSA
jgi:hypothetical protein